MGRELGARVRLVVGLSGRGQRPGPGGRRERPRVGVTWSGGACKVSLPPSPATPTSLVEGAGARVGEGVRAAWLVGGVWDSESDSSLGGPPPSR
jgi:hypothetical protein